MTPKNLSFLLIVLLLSSCGLRAVYSDKKHTEQPSNNPLNAIDIEPMGSVEAAEFYHHLSNILPRTTTAKYLLKIKFGSVSIPGAFQKNSDILRETINQFIQYQLFDLKTNQVLTSGRFRHMTSYNPVFTAYSAYAESEMALEDLTKRGAEEVRNRLILYFENNKYHEVLPIPN